MSGPRWHPMKDRSVSKVRAAPEAEERASSDAERLVGNLHRANPTIVT
jgi:hypothetical protein